MQTLSISGTGDNQGTPSRGHGGRGCGRRGPTRNVFEALSLLGPHVHLWHFSLLCLSACGRGSSAFSAAPCLLICHFWSGELVPMTSWTPDAPTSESVCLLTPRPKATWAKGPPLAWPAATLHQNWSSLHKTLRIPNLNFPHWFIDIHLFT